ncbi:hypothetical protein RI129_001143 [Pyrocoelia pectoralis]|uniref:Tyr recombinase domain-containing protein n=1 Tax=Pyrocoelia pectoralis TaxID=417401 RepID=A0AAN7V7K9_9COLE
MEPENISCTPPEVKELANKALNNLMPTKSTPKYEKEYENFVTWCDQRSVNTISENVVLAYFENMRHSKKSSTMWSNYSMLKTCLNIKKNIDISKFLKVIVFLKRNSENYVPKKSKILELEHIEKFLIDANDNHYLAMKNALIIGYSGACRRVELMLLTINDIEFKTDSIIVCIPKTKNNVPRVFAITQPTWMNLIKKYYQLRPTHTPHDRYFLTYRDGKCSITPMGINKIGQIPKSIATFLNFANPEDYTGHCFRRSSVSELANCGGDLITIKKHGGWKSSAVAEGYIDTTLKKKLEVAQKLSHHSATSTVVKPSTSEGCEDVNSSTTDHVNVCASGSTSEPINVVEVQSKTQNTKIIQAVPGVPISTGDNCTVTIKIYNNCTINNE